MKLVDALKTAGPGFETSLSDIPVLHDSCLQGLEDLHTMALDFSQYGGPSEEWLAVEKTLPALTFDINTDPVALRSAVNTERENRTAAAMAQLSAHVHTKDYSIPTRDGLSIQARTYRSVKKSESEKLPVYLYLHGGGFIFGVSF